MTPMTIILDDWVEETIAIAIAAFRRILHGTKDTERGHETDDEATI